MKHLQPPQQNRVAQPNLNPPCRAGAARKGVLLTVCGKAENASLFNSPAAFTGGGGFVRNLAMSCAAKPTHLAEPNTVSPRVVQGIAGLRDAKRAGPSMSHDILGVGTLVTEMTLCRARQRTASQTAANNPRSPYSHLHSREGWGGLT